MRAGTRQLLSVMAAFAIAVHTVLWVTVLPTAAVQAIDPFRVICHSDTSAPTEQVPSHGPSAPTHACDHCNLCSAVTPPLLPGTALAAYFEPARVLGIVRPANVARRDEVTAHPKLARGPPDFA